MPIYTFCAASRKRLAKAIEYETRFGIGANFKKGERRDHPVMDEDWGATAVNQPPAR